MLSIVNYGSGNIAAITNILSRLGVAHRVAGNLRELADAQKILLPGVGAFDQTMGQLEASGFLPGLHELVLGKKVPVLGICVGMQILADSSEEGTKRGLGWIPGAVRKMRRNGGAHILSLPHMGWNDVSPTKPTPLFKELEQNARFYFLHSYFFDCGETDTTIAMTDYGGSFTSAVHRENIYGVQFHPEKSHHYGVQLLKNFSEL